MNQLLGWGVGEKRHLCNLAFHRGSVAVGDRPVVTFGHIALGSPGMESGLGGGDGLAVFVTVYIACTQKNAKKFFRSYAKKSFLRHTVRPCCFLSDRCLIRQTSFRERERKFLLRYMIKCNNKLRCFACVEKPWISSRKVEGKKDPLLSLAEPLEGKRETFAISLALRAWRAERRPL